MKYIFTAFLVLLAMACEAANPTFQNFNNNQFLNSTTMVNIKSNAILTNAQNSAHSPGQVPANQYVTGDDLTNLTVNINTVLAAPGVGLTNSAANLTNYHGAFLDPTGPPFNAVGDGTTDDTQAITNCLNVASVLKVPVLFPGKSFKFTAQINISNNVAIYGTHGARLVCTSGQTFPSGVAIQTVFNNTNWFISGLEIDGGNANSIPLTDDGRTGLLLLDTEQPNCGMENVFVHGFGKGVRVFDSGANVDPQAHIHNLTCRWNYRGFQVDTGAEYVGYTSIYSMENAYGLWLEAGNNHFVGCSFDRNKTNLNVVTGPNPAHCQFIGCSFNHSVGLAVLATNIGPGAIFDGCAFLPPNIYITNSQGFSFVNCQMGWNPTGQQVTFDHSTNCFIALDTSPFGTPSGYTVAYSNNCVNCFHLTPNNAANPGFNIDNAGISFSTNNFFQTNTIGATNGVVYITSGTNGNIVFITSPAGGTTSNKIIFDTSGGITSPSAITAQATIQSVTGSIGGQNVFMQTGAGVLRFGINVNGQLGSSSASNIIAMQALSTNFADLYGLALIASNGVASKFSNAVVTVQATGITNNFGVNAKVLLGPLTAATFNIYDGYSNLLDTVSSATFTRQEFSLQPKGSITAASGLAGKLYPW